jgi:hypothetical protein
MATITLQPRRSGRAGGHVDGREVVRLWRQQPRHSARARVVFEERPWHDGAIGGGA